MDAKSTLVPKGAAGEEEEAAKAEMTAVPAEESSRTQKEKTKKARAKASVVVMHANIIKDDFWESRPWVLTGKPGKPLAGEG